MRRVLLVGLLSIAGAACGSSKNDGIGSALETANDGGTEGSAGSSVLPVEGGAGKASTRLDSGSAGVLEAGCTSSEAGADDLPDDEGTDSNCDGADGVVGRDVYVDPTAGADSAEGTPTSPVRSLDKALSIAAPRNGNVLVAAGTFALAKIEQVGSVSIYGGYASSPDAPATFTGKPNRSLTVVKAQDDTGIYLDKATTVTLAHLTIHGIDAKDHPSAHALRSDVPSLTLIDVVVQSAAAQDGTPGAKGSLGEAGRAGGVGSTWWSSQSNGAKGLTCAGVLQPDYTNGADANQPNVEGKAAGSGAAGAGTTASPGQGASSSPLIADGLIVWGAGSNGGTDGAPGYGGPGGVSTTSPVAVSGHSYSFYAGGGGTGGCPGGSGKGATSGGGSIAVLLLQGKLVVKDSLIRTGDGGNGGNGGDGGDGGEGGLGGIPAYDSLERYPSAPLLSLPATCPAASDPLSVSCSAYGRQGGKGGKGGAGGPGVGGWTVGILSAAGATAEIDPSTQFQLGGLGTGGFTTTSGVKGPDGRKQSHYELH